MVIPVVMAASTTADKGSGDRLRAGSARGMACRQSRVGGLIGRVGQRSGNSAAASGENEGSVRGEGGRLAVLPRRPTRNRRTIHCQRREIH